MIQFLKKQYNISKLFKIIFLIVVLSSFYGCIDIKSDYPVINYYKLEHDSLMDWNPGPLESTVVLRNFDIASQYKTNRFIAMFKESRVKLYYYHRWITDCQEVITDFVLQRVNNYDIFTGGLITSGSIVFPDYFLEGTILEMAALNDEDEEENNFVRLSIKINLIKREPMKNEENVLLSNIYHEKAQRKNNKAKTIAPAFSIAASNLVDNIIKDIYTTIKKDQQSNN